MKPMKKKTALIVLCFVLVATIAAFIAQVILEKGIHSKIIVRCLIPFALSISGIVRVATGSKTHSHRVYEDAYREELRNAFIGEKQKHLRKKLLNAIGLYNCNRYEAAANRLQGLLPFCKTDGDYCAVLMFLALCFTDDGLSQSAIDTYHQYLQHDPTCSTAWSNLGLLLQGQGKAQEAISCYENALRQNDKNPFAYNNMANAFYGLGEYDKAIDYGSRALELKSNIYQASNVVCLSYCALHNPEMCEKYYKISVTHGANPDNLQEAINRIRLGVNDLVPLPEPVKNALSDFSRKTAKPFVSIRLADRNESADGKSRFGGAPIGEAPLDGSGRPMRLLCALFCSEIHGVPDFPESGLLQFYIADNPLLGCDFEDPVTQRDFRVIYSEHEDVPKSEGTAKGMGSASYDGGAFPVLGCFGLDFVSSVGDMTCNDYRFRDELEACLEKQGADSCDDMDDALFEAICEERIGEEHRIGGYPCFTQYDPREQNPQLRKYDTLLLQIASQQHDGKDLIRIGDCGVIHFFIPRENLTQRDFSDVLYWWDCG